MDKRSAAWFALFVLFAINTMNFFDRLVIGAVAEPIRKEFELNDKMLGLLSTAFTLLYAFVGIPLGRLADKVSRKRVLSIGVIIWSLMTAISGAAQTFWQIFAARLGVGAAEASCAPAATSLIGDLFPPDKRGRALSVFMLGLPIGIALSFAVSGTVAKEYGWRAAFFVAGVPGLLFGIMVLFIGEPARGASERSDIGERRRPGSPYWLILSSPTMLWLIASGVLHNFCLYALSFFMTPFLMRFHALDVQQASFVAMAINGIVTLPGLLLGGYVGDVARHYRVDGGLIVVTVAVLASTPLFYFALQQPAGNVYAFLMLMGGAFALMYFYYSIVYAAVQDVTEPALRGTAMSVYFLAMYVLGGAAGPYIVGALSDYFTMQSAATDGATLSNAALESYRAIGLRSAMYIVPVLCLLLSGVLFAASRSARGEVERLNEWMKSSSEQ